MVQFWVDKYTSIEKLTELIKYNINSLCNIIDYNIENNIKLFRISSDIKCMNCTTPNLKISQLEEEWSKYKYTVLEKSHNKYLELREYLKNKNNISASIFFIHCFRKPLRAKEAKVVK